MHCMKLLGQRLMARDFDRQVAELQVRIAVLVIPPFLMGLCLRIQAAAFIFIAGVMPPMPMLGLSLL